MTKTVIHTNEEPSTEDLTFVDDLSWALTQAEEACRKASDEATNGDGEIFFYVVDQDGRAPQNVQVVEETLTDGSKVQTIVINFKA